MAPINQPAYAKDERALCFHGELLYEAKVLEHKFSEPNDKKSPILYRVHYKGWKNTWDDWVLPDRLRKFTEDNQELARTLRLDAKQAQEKLRNVPKSASKKKAGGSDFSSLRGSEERHSSVPVTGRGTKRGRDLDLEKVGDKFTSMSVYYFLDHYPRDSDSGYNTGELDSPNPKRCRLSLQNDEPPFGLDGSNDLRNNDSTVGTITKSGRRSKPSARALNRQTDETKKEVPSSTAKIPHQRKPRVKKQPEKKAEQKIEKKPEKKAEKKPEKKTEESKKPKQSAKRAKKPANTETRSTASPSPASQHIIDISSESELEEIPPNYHGDPTLHYGTVNPSSRSQEDAFHSRPPVRLPIPDHIKALLVDDWENVTKNLSLVPLPSPHPVSEILTAYLEEEKLRRRVGSVEYDLLEEVVAGLREYFDHTLGRILLYRFEREQYFQVRKKGEIGEAGWIDKPASEIYGAEHLCRLFVSLPELIAQTNMDTQSVNRLREELAKITSWLGKNSARFFTAEYEAATPEYIEKARGAE